MNATRKQLNISRTEIENRVVEALAEVLRSTPEQIAAEMATNGGNIEVTSKESMAMASIIEEQLGIGALFSPLDFATDITTGATAGNAAKFSLSGCMDPGEDTSVGRFVEIIVDKLALSK